MTKRTTDRIDPGRMELAMVATLHAILETGSVSKAAERLGVTQPSVSQTLRRLRQYFGDDLFVRSGNALRPTPRAVSLGPLASRLMRDIDKFSEHELSFDASTAHRQFVICMPDVAEYMALPALLRTLSRIAPGCSVRGRRVARADLRAVLASGEVDLATGTLIGAEESLRQLAIGEYHVVCMVGAASRWAKHGLTREHYAAAKHIAVERISDSEDPIALRVHEAGIHRAVALEVANHFVAAKLVAQAEFICTVPRHMGLELARMFPVTLHPLPFPIQPLITRLAWHERFHKDPGHVWLRRHVERAWRGVLEFADPDKQR